MCLGTITFFSSPHISGSASPLPCALPWHLATSQRLSSLALHLTILTSCGTFESSPGIEISRMKSSSEDRLHNKKTGVRRCYRGRRIGRRVLCPFRDDHLWIIGLLAGRTCRLVCGPFIEVLISRLRRTVWLCSACRQTCRNGGRVVAILHRQRVLKDEVREGVICFLCALGFCGRRLLGRRIMIDGFFFFPFYSISFFFPWHFIMIPTKEHA